MTAVTTCRRIVSTTRRGGAGSAALKNPSPGSRLGGFGRQHREFMKQFPNLGLTYIQLRDRSRGRVTLRSGHPVVHYEMNHGDRARTRKALKLLAGICLEGGAAKVATTHVKPVVMTR